MDLEAVTNTDYLVAGGAALKEALERNTEATRKLADALQIFSEMEAKTKDLIRDKLTAPGSS